MPEDSRDLSLHLDADAVSAPDLQDFLQQVLEAAGGQAGILTTWEEGQPQTHRTSQFGFQPEIGRALARLVEEAAPGVAAESGESVSNLQRRFAAESLRAGLGPLHAVAMPLRIHGRSVGLFCMLHPTDAPGFLRDSPQMYNLVIDRLEIVVQNARLLQHLLRERLWLEALVTQSSDGVAILDRDGQVVGLNAAMERLSGWKVSQAVGRPAHTIFPLQTSAGPGVGLALYRQRPSVAFPITAEPVEARLVDRDGQPVDVEVSGVTVRDEAGQPAGWVMTVRDTRRRKETERLGRIFLSAMSHELQTPIAVIKGFAGLLSDPAVQLGPEQARDKAAVILDEAERLQQMIRQMLEATSIQAGGIRVHLEPVDLEELVGRTLRRLEALARGRSVVLEARIPADLPPARADAARIEQVLTNLVENAIKHGAGGHVLVQAQAADRELRLRVTDRGSGISPEDRQRIFGIFERGAETRARGSGLGLFIAKALVEAHGGRIGVEAGPEGGACFYFTLPREMG